MDLCLALSILNNTESCIAILMLGYTSQHSCQGTEIGHIPRFPNKTHTIGYRYQQAQLEIVVFRCDIDRRYTYVHHDSRESLATHVYLTKPNLLPQSPNYYELYPKKTLSVRLVNAYMSPKYDVSQMLPKIVRPNTICPLNDWKCGDKIPT